MHHVKGRGNCRLSFPERIRRIRREQRSRARCGAAIVEFAVCLPMAVFLLLSTIEITRSIQLQHTLQLAVYEGARTAILPGATAADVTSAARAVLDARGCSAASVTLTPSNPQWASVGQYIRVRASISAGANALLAQRFMNGRTMTARADAMKEY